MHPQPGVSLRISLDLCGLFVHRPTYFDAQAGCRTIEVENIGAHGMVPAKAQAKVVPSQH
jgi:hypothetical protein